MLKLHYKGPIVLAIMDGVGLNLRRSGNAVRQAHTEFLDFALSRYLNVSLDASGEAVGILSGQMGNSEVGHNALGAGQIIKQGIAGIEAAFKTGDIWRSKAWRGAMKQLGAGGQDAARGTLHFAGIFSDGGVHSDIAHLEQMIQRAYDEGVRKIRIHCVFDGRDVAPQSEPKYIERIEKFCAQFKDADFRIASGAGRMIATADRYGNDWGMVKLGWDMMVHGKAPRTFKSASEAIKTFRKEDATVQDQYLPAFVVVGEDKPVGKVKDGDAFIYYDFRADRAVEIAQAFVEEDFDKFNRGKVPEIYFAGMMEYDGDKHIPKHVLVPPVVIEEPLNVFLGKQQISQLAVSETVKFGHVTYYFNGNSYKKAPGEKHIEIPSDTMPFDTRPWMKSAETTDIVLENMEKYDFIRINYPAGDMVGHFAELEPTIVAVEAVDIQLARLAKRVDELGGVLIITADHGNAEELIDRNGMAKTSHTTNQVPCIFYDNTPNAKKYRKASLKDPGLTNLAATIATLLGQPDYPAHWRKPLIKVPEKK